MSCGLVIVSKITGLARFALALFATHGLDTTRWPQEAREGLGLWRASGAIASRGHRPARTGRSRQHG
jgi:hypothetical protein